MSAAVELADYRRQVAELYAEVRRRSADSPAAAWRLWREGRDVLFKKHPQSPLRPEQRQSFQALSYFDYDATYRLEAHLDPPEALDLLEVELEDDGLMKMVPAGVVRLQRGEDTFRLCVYRVLGYGGGLFLPFRDATCQSETFGGGRYLIDTIKGADLGSASDRLILDFNFSYNPSCAYSPQWSCPLAPVENWLECRIQAGEKRFQSPPGHL